MSTPRITREDAWHLEHQSDGEWHRPFPPMSNPEHARQDLKTFRELNPDDRYRLVHECRYVQVVA